MEGEKLTIEGHRYVGRFEVRERSHSYRERVDNEVGYYYSNRTNIWHEGGAVIKDKQTGLEQKFLVRSKGPNEEHFVLLDNQLREVAQNYKGVADLSLEKMYEEAKNSEKIVPEIWPTSLDKKLLSEKGLIPDPQLTE